MRMQAFFLCTLLLAGCNQSRSNSVGSLEANPTEQPGADFRILFVGNSHTSMHGLPDLVGRMIQFQKPGTTVRTRIVGVAFLEDLARDAECRRLLESRSWDFLVLQAQKISGSGKFNYSKQEGIDIAKFAKAHQVQAVFYPEWGRKDVAGEGERYERVYDEMARASNGRTAPVGRAWDLALAERPNLLLHADDGNHQSRVGAFLTACVLAGVISGQPVDLLGDFPFRDVDADLGKFLAAKAAQAIADFGQRSP